MQKIICENEDCKAMYNGELYKACPACKTVPKRIVFGTREDPIETDIKIMRRVKNDKY